MSILIHTQKLQICILVIYLWFINSGVNNRASKSNTWKIFFFDRKTFKVQCSMIEKKIQETKMFNYLIQLIEHPIFRIPNILFLILSIKVLNCNIKIHPKIQYNRLIILKRKNTLQHLRLGELKFGIRKLGVWWTERDKFQEKQTYFRMCWGFLSYQFLYSWLESDLHFILYLIKAAPRGLANSRLLSCSSNFAQCH